MNRDFKTTIRSLCFRFQLPVIMLAMLLSRTPALKMLLERNAQSLPRASFLLKWMTGASSVVGGVNAVTGATASVQLLEGFDNTTAYVGEPFTLKFASTGYVVKSYRLGGPLPDGLELDPLVTQFGVGTISGTPTKKGVHNIDKWDSVKQN